MTLLVEVVILIVSMFVLSKASHTVVKSSVKIARITKLGDLAVGFLIVSVATSLPELVVSTSAIMSGDIGISIGNVLGSNIMNICLVIGLMGLLRPVRMTEKTLMKLSEMLFLCGIILVMMLISTSPGRGTGINLLVLFFLFSLYSVRKKITLGEIRLEDLSRKIPRLKFSVSFYKTIFFLIIGLIFLIVSSRFVVDSASSIASILGIAESIIGATIIAIGTSLPELTVTLDALKENHLKLGLGNTIGSCLTNLTLVLGSILVLAPFKINIEVFTTLVSFVLFSTVLLYLFLGRFGRKKLERKEGIVLLIVYILFLIMTLSLTIPGLGYFSQILKLLK